MYQLLLSIIKNESLLIVLENVMSQSRLKINWSNLGEI